MTFVVTADLALVDRATILIAGVHEHVHTMDHGPESGVAKHMRQYSET